jgi:hypothetical protein
VKISQREARRLRKRVEELEAMEDKRRMAWRSEYPGGVFLEGIAVQPWTYAALKTARKLGHAVVVTTNGENTLQFYALPLSS